MRTIVVTDKMQERYQYICVQRAGKNFDANFKPDLSPKEMLELGFSGIAGTISGEEYQIKTQGKLNVGKL